MSKGQGTLMQVMIAVLIVAILGLFLFVTQTSTTIENIEDVSATSQAFTAKQIGLSLYTTSFIASSSNAKYPSIAHVLSYACEYGKPARQYRYTVSEQVPVRFETEEFLESYLNQTITGPYYFYIDCNENKKRAQSKKIEAGSQPPTTGEILVTRIEIPLARGNKTAAFLYQWQ